MKQPTPRLLLQSLFSPLSPLSLPAPHPAGLSPHPFPPPFSLFPLLFLRLHQGRLLFSGHHFHRHPDTHPTRVCTPGTSRSRQRPRLLLPGLLVSPHLGSSSSCWLIAWFPSSKEGSTKNHHFLSPPWTRRGRRTHHQRSGQRTPPTAPSHPEGHLIRSLWFLPDPQNTHAHTIR